jgi:starch phosphorylase
MGQLAPQFSANRMLREYVDDVYVSAAERLRQRARDGGRGARELVQWAETIDHAWSGVAFGTPDVRIARDGYVFSIPVCLGALDPGMVRVELYADPIAGELATRISMHREDSGDLGKGVVYSAEVVTTRPSSHFTPRVIPFHPNACVPAESQRIHWAW